MNSTKSQLILLIFLIGFGLYSNTLSHNYVLDDFSVIKENFLVKKGIEGIPAIWKTHYRFGYGYVQANLYRPLTLSLFAIQWEIFPNSPMFAHFFNVFLFSILGIIIFIFLELLWGEKNRVISFIASLLFISHPIHTEVVANIKSIDDILVMGFSLTAIILLIKHLNKSNHLYFVCSLLLFFLALLSKESTITLLLMIPSILILFRSKSVFDSIKISAWYLIPVSLYSILRIKILGSFSGNKTIASLDNLLVAAPTEISRIATAIKIMGLYVWKLVVPHPLMNDYSLKQIEINGFENLFTWLSIFFFLGLIITLIKVWKSKKVIAFGIIFYLITISLYSNLIVTIGTSFGERLLFIPSLGFCIVVAYLIQYPFKNKFNQLGFYKSFASPLLITALLVCVYSFKTIDRNRAWKDNFTLYSTDVVNCDRSARCHYYYGLGLMKEKALSSKNPKEKRKWLIESIKSFDNALAILPSYSDAWGQKGLAFYRLNDFTNAEKAYQKAIELNPSNTVVLSNLGSLYFNQKQYQTAKFYFETALKANPNYIDALANYASTLGTLGDLNGAITYFKKAIDLKPEEPSYYEMIGMTYKNLGNQQQANQYFQKAQQLRN